MELVRHTLLHFITSQFFQGCILVFEYSYFLLQNKDVSNALELALKEYKRSGTQAAVLRALKHAIKEHANDHQALQDIIFDIILANQMCKLFFLSILIICNDMHKQKDFCD